MNTKNIAKTIPAINRLLPTFATFAAIATSAGVICTELVNSMFIQPGPLVTTIDALINGGLFIMPIVFVISVLRAVATYKVDRETFLISYLGALLSFGNICLFLAYI